MRESFSRLRQIEHHIDDTIRMYENTQADDYPAHWNNAFEIILPIENEYTVCINDDAYRVLPDEILIIPAGSVHEIFAPSAGKRYIMMVDPSEFHAVEGLSAAQHSFYPCVHLRHDQHEDLLPKAREYLLHAIEEYDSGAYFNRAGVRLWLGLMFVTVARSLLGGGMQENTRSHTSSVFLDVCTYIANHCTQKLTLEEVAAYCGYSKYHFARIFKTYAGMSFYDFYMRQRVLRCEQMLGNPSLSITEVALRSGFGSIATFNRIFKQYEKITPSEYRRLRQLLKNDRQSANETAISEQ